MKRDLRAHIESIPDIDSLRRSVGSMDEVFGNAGASARQERDGEDVLFGDAAPTKRFRGKDTLIGDASP